jgi:RNA polymerase sigma factor (sigma-70 family)
VLRARTRVPDGYDGERAWLFRTLVNVCRDRIRRATVRARFYRAFVTASVQPDPEPSFVARLSVEQALHELNARRRAIVVLHEIDGESVESVADLLGIAPVTVRWHLSKARRELCKLLG